MLCSWKQEVSQGDAVRARVDRNIGFMRGGRPMRCTTGLTSVLSHNPPATCLAPKIAFHFESDSHHLHVCRLPISRYTEQTIGAKSVRKNERCFNRLRDFPTFLVYVQSQECAKLLRFCAHHSIMRSQEHHEHQICRGKIRSETQNLLLYLDAYYLCPYL